jgi:hypothetical protein
MQRDIGWKCMLLTLLIVLAACSLGSAEIWWVSDLDRGWYSELGVHIPDNDNYAVGDLHGRACSTSDCFSDLRNFFVFDLSLIPKPIQSAKLVLNVHGTLPIPGYFSNDPSETYELHDVITPIATLLDGTGGLAAHADLGSGVVYGSRIFTSADVFEGGGSNVVEIQLNSSAINAMNGAHGGRFALGGSVTTLDDKLNAEYVFAYSFTAYNGISYLELSLVPEPSTLLLLGIGAISLLGYRKARSTG